MQYVSPPPAKKTDIARVMGSRVLTSDEGYAILREKEEIKQREKEDKEKRKQEREDKRKQKSEFSKKRAEEKAKKATYFAIYKKDKMQATGYIDSPNY